MTRIRSTDSSRVQDRRGQGGGGGLAFPGLGGGGGGLGLPMKSGGGLIGLLIVAAIIFLPKLFGGSTSNLTGGGGGEVATGDDDTCESDLEQTLCGANEDVQDFWEREYPSAFGSEFDDTDMVFFSGSVATGCGTASSQTGPFYCPADRYVYFDLDFLVQLQDQFGATGDLAAQYIVAHEFGHHVQNLTGQNQPPSDFQGTENQWSVLVELQADCYAGVWAQDAAQREDRNGLPLFEEGEINEAINAAGAVGDDRIQMQTQGRTNPETYTHGTSEQRQTAFKTGYTTGDPAECDPRSWLT
ncbi:neutral zinc metallopeptidase [Desertimonas flava]|jgi:predicted metalloprotease|uniref:KPN_02809 family neutral zinc metallopeptidase n=1 Tax=Desertimonas flava TaxID=2064846 RepID=UPI000E3499CA|nr:neutral zinc metallopeptidase [Desertimonas flava]